MIPSHATRPLSELERTLADERDPRPFSCECHFRGRPDLVVWCSGPVKGISIADWEGLCPCRCHRRTPRGAR